MPTRNQRIVANVVRWFLEDRREFPWRPARLDSARDPYRVLVSEIMLQQTQASRVADRYRAFLDRFPTIEALAAADEQDVLALWSGLGYYSRARNLHAAARVVIDEHGGRLPRTVEALASLPGVGRYTAGAVASLAFGEPAPAVDANVARVLLRIEGREANFADHAEARRTWALAQSLVDAATPERGAAVLNESLIELGAVVCTPRAPGCGACPLSRLCVARRKGLVDRIPAPKPALSRRPLYCATIVVRDDACRVLLERRPGAGLWAGLWQCPTLESDKAPPSAAAARAHAEVTSATPAGELRHATTHRDVRFKAWSARVAGGQTNGRRWIGPGDLDAVGLSSPQRRLIDRVLDSDASLFGGAHA